jgi:lipid-A-disaccharide synthase
MRYYLIAGEASGDLHGSNLMKSLQKEDSSAEFRFWGGDYMSEVSDGLVKHYKDTAVMGIVEVVSKLKKIRKNLIICKEDIQSWNPDVIILIDYPGFNLRIAKYAKERGFKTFYYIPPKVWARGESRIKKLKEYLDRIYIIFPFEQEYFKSHNLNTLYFGNPLYDSILSNKAVNEPREEFLMRHNLEERPSIALLAGSRKHEINYLLPKLRILENDFKNYELLLAGAPSIEAGFYETLLKGSRIKLIFGETYSILKHSEAAVVSSGTASLEAGIIGTPQVVCYGLNPITAYIGKFIIKVKFASLVNLILNKELVKELLQWNCTPENISRETEKILKGRDRKRILSGYKKVKNLLGGEGASEKVAKSMVKEIQKLKKENLFATTHETPLGRLKIICNDSNLISVEYLSEDKDCTFKRTDNHPILIETVKQLDEYFQEKRKVFHLPIELKGTNFQKKVWEELQNIPYGQIKTYGEIAAVVETKDASRAVGLACKMNPLLIVVPCHRVIGANNKLTGFAIGIDKKSYLLDLERAYLNTDNSLFKNEEDQK